jgi:hypothetical protein
MRQDAGEERQRLSAVYAEKYDGELLELAADSGNLTEIAQQVLRDEMQKRGLNADRGASVTDSAGTKRAATITEEPANYQLSPDGESEETDQPAEYTWKTELCECPTIEQARQLAEALRRAGIDSWIQASGVNSRYGAFDITYPKLTVAADQLEQAKAIAAQPIPQDILDAHKEADKEEPGEFELPKCPACGSGDTVLIGVDPSNTWQCEACEREWSEPVAADTGEAKT